MSVARFKKSLGMGLRLSVVVCSVGTTSQSPTSTKENIMALTMQKRAKIARSKRIAYVASCSFTGWKKGSPFLDANWDRAAEQFIETGDESLKNKFPGPRR